MKKLDFLSADIEYAAFMEEKIVGEKPFTERTENGLRRGYTTGSCGAAASLAAASLLFLGERLEMVSFLTPKKIRLNIPVESWETGEGWARCGVRKSAGDDPDITDGVLVYVCVSVGPENVKDKFEGKGEWELPVPKGCVEVCGDRWYAEKVDDALTLYLRGKDGVGKVTRAGLSCPAGMWAINPVPRSMIFRQVASVCKAAGYPDAVGQNVRNADAVGQKAGDFDVVSQNAGDSGAVSQKIGTSGSVWITLEIPEGKALAGRTFNPKLGIVDGLSVLGSSGIVEPMSEPALLETIRLEIRQKALEGGKEEEKSLLLTPGNYGERFLAEELALPVERAVKCSNYIGRALDMAADAGVKNLLLVGHAGKLIKLAAGIMNTHSRTADGRMECLAAYGAACGASEGMVREILNCVTVDEALGILERKEGLRERAMELAVERISAVLKRRAGGRLQAEAVLFTNERGILGMTKGAERLLEIMRDGRG